jgi:hypothetical protein
MPYSDLYLGLTIVIGVIGFVIRVVAPILVQTSPDVATLGAALIVLSVAAFATGRARGI